MVAGTTDVPEYQTVWVGGAYLVKQILNRLGVARIIDDALQHQPDVETTYGALLQVIVANRLTLQPVPLYQLGRWAAEHGMDRVFGVKPEWLEDSRIGAGLDGVASHQVAIWMQILRRAHEHYGLDLEWLHADTTSTYFEGGYEEGNADTLLERKKAEAAGIEPPRVPLLVEGYNKDGKRNKVQMVLSLTTAGRVPIWYRPWDGNQTDGEVYLSDLKGLGKAILLPGNTVLIGDRKLCNEANILECCRVKRLFLAPHPWTRTAKDGWREVVGKLARQELQWSRADYVSRNNARKPGEKRPQHRVLEVPHPVTDADRGEVFTVRWVFSHLDTKADQDARQREKAIAAAEEGLARLAGLVGKYHYKTRESIEAGARNVLAKAKANAYFAWNLEKAEGNPGWALHWERRAQVIADDALFDGVALHCTNVPEERLSAAGVLRKYKEQACVEQSIDFIKSPLQIRPMWLHLPERIAALTLLIMIAALVAALLEQQVRRWIARSGRQVAGLMPENRDNAYPTARALLRAFDSYALVITRHDDGREETHIPRLGPVQQQIWDTLGLAPMACL